MLHQSAKQDMADMLKVIELILSPIRSHQSCDITLVALQGACFMLFLQTLQFSLNSAKGVRLHELTSMRADSDTWVMQTTESGDLYKEGAIGPTSDDGYLRTRGNCTSIL